MQGVTQPITSARCMKGADIWPFDRPRSAIGGLTFLSQRSLDLVRPAPNPSISWAAFICVNESLNAREAALTPYSEVLAESIV